MPQLIRSKNHSIWFRHIDDPQGDLLRELRRLEPGQAVVLQIGGREGVWRRFNQGAKGRTPEALSCANDRATSVWNSLPVDGVPVDVLLVRVEPPSAQTQVKRKSRSRRKATGRPGFTPACSHLAKDVLCIGIDVAWWGGLQGPSKKHTRSECLALAARVNGKWSDLEIRRVDLTLLDQPNADDVTPNADPKADLLSQAVKEELARFGHIAHVVLAADVPMKALARRDLNPPQKTKERSTEAGRKTAAFRACDLKWHAERDKSPQGWRNVQILPGAPLYPRVIELVSKLRMLGFSIYQHPWGPHPTYTAVECFPNEVLWSAGVLGHVKKLTEASIRAYKRLGKVRARLPSDVFLSLCRHTLLPALSAASLDAATCERWLSSFFDRLKEDLVVTDDPAEGRSGKKFDDCMDSVLSLTAAVAFAEGKAHVHQGDDPEDGHIVGPGLPPIEGEKGI